MQIMTDEFYSNWGKHKCGFEMAQMLSCNGSAKEYIFNPSRLLYTK